VAELDEFSVFWWDPDGNCHAERRYIGALAATELAHSLVLRPAASLGIIRRIIITDGGDFTVFEWIRGQGVTWPEQGRP
jgi:P2-related tail formation protein